MQIGDVKNIEFFNIPLIPRKTKSGIKRISALYRSYSEWSVPAERKGGYIMMAELETTNSSRKKRPSRSKTRR